MLLDFLGKLSAQSTGCRYPCSELVAASSQQNVTWLLGFRRSSHQSCTATKAHGSSQLNIKLSLQRSPRKVSYGDCIGMHGKNNVAILLVTCQPIAGVC